MTVPVAARRLGFTLKYVYDLVYSGKLNANKIAGRWQIPEREVEAIAARREQR